MEHKTKCIDCKCEITVSLSDEDLGTAKSVGLNYKLWLERLVCEGCMYKRDNGGKTAPYKPDKSDWLIG